MLLYFFVFIISTLFFRVGIGRGRWNVFSIIGLFIPSVFASIRDVNVGTDTIFYASLYSQAISVSFESLPVEPFFYLSSQIGEHFYGFSFVLFVYQFLSLLFVYLAAYDQKNNIEIWLVMLLYLLFFYNLSLNIMRQCTAGAYLLFISQYLQENKIKKYITLSLIGTIFHFSILIGSILILSINLIISRHYGNCKGKYIWLYLLLLFIIQVLFIEILSIFTTFAFSNVGNKISGYIGNGSSYVSIVSFALPLFMVFQSLKNKKFLGKSVFYNIFLLSLTDMCMNCLGSYNVWFYRFSYYFSIFYCLYLPYICKKKPMIKYITVGLFIFLWWWIYDFRGSNATVPYLFAST